MYSSNVLLNFFTFLIIMNLTFALSFSLSIILLLFVIISGSRPEACFYREKIKIITGSLSHLLGAGKQEQRISAKRTFQKYLF